MAHNEEQTAAVGLPEVHGAEHESVRACVRVSVCPREGRVGVQDGEDLLGGSGSQPAGGSPPGARLQWGRGTPPTTPPRLAAASWTLRVAWGSSVLDGGGVRTGETVWVGEDVRGTSQVWVSEHDPRGVASECGPGVG